MVKKVTMYSNCIGETFKSKCEAELSEAKIRLEQIEGAGFFDQRHLSSLVENASRVISALTPLIVENELDE